MSVHELTTNHAQTDTSTSTRFKDPSRKRIVQTLWLIVMLFTLAIAVIGLFDLYSVLDYGCLCNTTMVGKQDGEIILFPLPNVPTNGLFQHEDVIIAVDGQPIPAEMSLQEAISLIDAGPAGSLVELTIQTDTEASRTVVLTRDAGYAVVQGGLTLGMSLDGAIAYSLSLTIMVLLGFAGISGLIAWRRVDDWMVLYTSWALLTLALLAPGDTTLWEMFKFRHPSALWQVYETLAWGGIIHCFLIFPNGGTYPRWSLAIVLLWGL